MKLLPLILFASFLILGCGSSNEDNNKPPDCIYTPYAGNLHSLPLYINSPKIALRGYDEDFGQMSVLFDQAEGKTTNREENCNQEIFLNDVQKDSLFRLLKGFKTSSPIEASACFVPRHKIIFYDSRDSINGYIDICFSCNLTESNLDEFSHVCTNQLDYYKKFVKWCGISAGFPDK